MSIDSIKSFSAYASHRVDFTPQVNRENSNAQGSNDNGNQGLSVSRQHHGGIRHAMMDTFRELGLSIPDNTNNKESKGSDSEGYNNGSGSKVGSIRREMSKFMHGLFQAVRSQVREESSGASTPYSSLGGLSFETGLTSLISTLADGSQSNNPQISRLQDTYKVLVQDLQSAQADGSNGQQPPSLQDFLAAMQQNLLNSQKPILTTGNVLNTQG